MEKKTRTTSDGEIGDGLHWKWRAGVGYCVEHEGQLFTVDEVCQALTYWRNGHTAPGNVTHHQDPRLHPFVLNTAHSGICRICGQLDTAHK